jgi:methylmalonyl-CoA mutase N-terminal domain/subunit
LGGSFHVESLTDSMEAAISGIMEEVARAGDAVQAIESGLIQRLIDESAFRRQRAVETGDQIVVGVNRYQSAAVTGPTGQSQRGTPSGAGDQIQRLSRVRNSRDGAVVRQCLESITDAARSKAPLMPGILEAVRGYATIGEICGALRSVYGEHTS